MSVPNNSRFRRALPVVGTLYLLFLVSQPPPLRWVGLICLAILTPFLLGWVAGKAFGVGPWGDR
ncbi:hypothetical protein GJ629_06280 [Halapricum sp. CBA1109]|jgi:hypothetical protein|uniref:hypothetical protein n=1 Tax=Halapricum sp. CBA1109 TaxID=2668068 RepID=UPI0012FB840D|nr:hypothetical protein [Halapricum sp. CBA1109]MUV89550.1 hypothetical protein [Halapricum sp. CBA1109]